MANSYYQTITTPKLYVSYPLWQYANGALDSMETNTNANNEDIIRILQLDPSKRTNINPDELLESNYIKYKIVPASDDFTNVIDSGLWNFDFMGILGHNLASSNVSVSIQANNDVNDVIDLNTTSIVNHMPNGTPEYDGWSLFNLDDKPENNYREIKIKLGFEQGINETPIIMNSLFFGKSFTFPQNADLNTTVKFDYGVKQKQTISGKTVSQINWSKPNNWITEPFGLTEPFGERGDNFQRRSGRRTWSISFDSLAPDKVMNQMPMMNSNGWTAQDNHSTGADGIESLYNINNAVDFYTNVVHRTMGGHLPMLLQVDSSDPSPHNFAIVRMKPDYVISQKSPNLYNIKLTLVEQI
tara:strand:- start:58 stop:1125 length:1068 start_codon:yes stop_codon:yes gene_type:complete